MDEPKTETVSPEELQALKTQIENLNKGIAQYRDEKSRSDSELEKEREKNEQLAKQLKELSKGEEELAESDKKKLEAWAKEHGFITTEELEKKQKETVLKSAETLQRQAIDEFIADHPEYDDDATWKVFEEEFGQYRLPTSVQGYRKLFQKIHKDLSGNDEGGVKARLITKGRLTLGGGSQGSGETDEKRLQSLREKYPNLSEGEIVARMKEIDELFPKKKEKKK